MIDYLGVSGNKRDGWTVRSNRLNRKMLCCKSTGQSDIINALYGWGVLPTMSGYRVASEDGQFTVYEDSTDKPMCAFFRVCGDS